MWCCTVLGACFQNWDKCIINKTIVIIFLFLKYVLLPPFSWIEWSSAQQRCFKEPSENFTPWDRTAPEMNVMLEKNAIFTSHFEVSTDLLVYSKEKMWGRMLSVCDFNVISLVWQDCTVSGTCSLRSSTTSSGDTSWSVAVFRCSPATQWTELSVQDSRLLYCLITEIKTWLSEH